GSSPWRRTCSDWAIWPVVYAIVVVVGHGWGIRGSRAGSPVGDRVPARYPPEPCAVAARAVLNSHPALASWGGSCRDMGHPDPPDRDPAMLRAAPMIMSAVACAAPARWQD